LTLAAFLDGPVDGDDDDVDVDEMDETDLLVAGATAEQLYAASSPLRGRQRPSGQPVAIPWSHAHRK
jgi:hypothetical protein